MSRNHDQIMIPEGKASHDCGFLRRQLTRWGEDGAVAKSRGGKGATFNKCLKREQIETDIATILAAPFPDGFKRTRNREPNQMSKRQMLSRDAWNSGGGAVNRVKEISRKQVSHVSVVVGQHGHS